MLRVLLAKVSYVPKRSVNREFSTVESNAEFGENFRLKPVNYAVYRMK